MTSIPTYSFPSFSPILVVGFLGGFTTFSSFGLEVFTLLKHHPWVALFDVAIQLVFGLLGVAGGFALGCWLVWANLYASQNSPPEMILAS